jgi:deoxyinosine 3'endonuclease (endonuclease V)
VFFSSKKIKKPIYISPGNKISFTTSLKIVKNLSTYKIPEPLRLAHILANKNLKS